LSVDALLSRLSVCYLCAYHSKCLVLRPAESGTFVSGNEKYFIGVELSL
jgi:hypothetical protein